MSALIRLPVRPKTSPPSGERWSKKFATKPEWQQGYPSFIAVQIEHDIDNAADWAWLQRQVRQLRALYETRTGKNLGESWEFKRAGDNA